MLKRLKWRLVLMVILMLLAISAGIVLSINGFNERQIHEDAYSTLSLLIMNDGRRPINLQSDMAPPAPPDDPASAPPAEGALPTEGAPLAEGALPTEGTFPLPGDADRPGFADFRRGRMESRELQANLGNYIVVTLAEDGTPASFDSDRADLYTQDEVTSLAAQMLGQGLERGQVGWQFYALRTLQDGSRQLLILDNRLAGESARQVLRTTILVTAAAWLALSAGAVWLITRMLRPVEDAFIRQRQFVSDASHELKTPLAVISANAQALAREQGRNELTDYILSEVGRADSLVKNLLSLARLDQPGQVSFQEFDLSQALLSVVLPFESTVFEAGRTLETEIPEGVRYTGQEDMIKQLTVILLSNALKYSNEGGLIRLQLEARGSKRILTVMNTGEGIAPDHRERVFDRFWRADDAHSSAVPGHGLGLAIARSIVTLHHGRITAGGEWHQNAVFTVTLN